MSEPENTRRNFLKYSLLGMGGIGIYASVSVIGKSMGPGRGSLAEEATLDLDLNKLSAGNEMFVRFDNKIVLVRNRTPSEVSYSQSLDKKSLYDRTANNWNLSDKANAVDSNRSAGKRSEYFVAYGYCTRPFKCVVQSSASEKWHWLCPCCGSRYDPAGRVIKGPAPRNMLIPRYSLSSSNILSVLPEKRARIERAIENAI